MYTYKLGGMIITDELYHDDLDSMTFGRKDQNELYHYGIKGMQHGKRRFQNEDGSLTMAGRRRYDVGMPSDGAAATNSNSGTFNKTSAVNRQTFASSNRPSGGRMTNVARTDSGTGNRAGGFSAARNAITASSSQSVKNSTNSGKKAADNLFSKIGNAATGAFNSAKQWGNQAAQDVANTATNVYNGARELAGQAVDAVKDKAQDVVYDIQGLANTPEARDIANGVNGAIDKAKELGGQVAGAATNVYNGARGLAGQAVQKVGNAVNTARDWAGDRANEAGELIDRNITGNSARNAANDINKAADYSRSNPELSNSLRDKASSEQAKADNSLFGRIGNAARGVGNWVGDRANDVAGAATNAYNGARDVAGQVGDWVGDRARDVSGAAQNAYNGARNAANQVGDWVGDRAQDVAGAAQNAYNGARDAANQVGDWVGDRARDVSDAAQNAYNGAREVAGQVGNWVGNRVSDVSDFARDRAQDVSDWYTGDKARREAQRYDNVAQNFERNGDRNVNEGADRMSNAMNEDQFWSGNGQRNLGYNQHDLASQYGQKGDEAQARYDAAPRQRINSAVDAAGQWLNNRINPQQQEAERTRALSDKPSGLSDEYWMEYKANGGTRAQYERELKNRRNNQNGSR